MISVDILSAIEALLSEHTGFSITISNTRPLSGGDINSAYQIATGSGLFFMKYNRNDRYPKMFEAEARGLQLLQDTQEIRVPDVIGAGETGGWSFLVLEYFESAGMKRGFWEAFGRSLARMHKHFGDSFGLDHDNYIGSLPQSNNSHNNWTDFFIKKRLTPQLKMATDAGLAGREMISGMERLYTKLDEIFPKEPPSLIHGDLWSGNFMVDNRGEAALIDPAVYYGHREMDIGMSKLFGGFSGEFYHAYNEVYPLAPGWESRVEICNLYPLLVHVNLFGGGYVGSVEGILRRF
jgi:fructosamine-3-kinase